MQNDAGTVVSDWHKSDTAETRFVPGDDAAKENAATSAKVSGAKLHKKHDISCDNTTAKRSRSAMARFGKDGHKRIAKVIGYALTLGTGAAWEAVSALLVARLSVEERAALAYAALNSLDDDTAYMTASVALFGTLHGEAVA